MATTRQRLREAHQANPELGSTELAEQLGVARQRIEQLAREEKIRLKSAPRGLGSRRRLQTSEAAPAYGIGPQIIAPPKLEHSAAVLLTAADLTRRGYAVFLPINQHAKCDLVSIDRLGRVDQVAVRKAKRAGGEVRYDTPENERRMSHAFVLTEEPISYRPELPAAEKNR